MVYFIETFETGDVFTIGKTGISTRSATSAKNGSYGLAITPSAIYRQITKDEIQTRGSSFKVSGFVRTDPTYSTSGLNGIVFAVPQSLKTDDTTKLGYQAILDVRNTGGTASQNSFQLRKDYASATLAGSNLVTVSPNTWYRIDVTWDSSGLITAKLYDATGSLLDTISATDQTYTSGMWGVGCYSDSSFDDVSYGIQPTGTTATVAFSTKQIITSSLTTSYSMRETITQSGADAYSTKQVVTNTSTVSFSTDQNITGASVTTSYAMKEVITSQSIDSYSTKQVISEHVIGAAFYPFSINITETKTELFQLDVKVMPISIKTGITDAPMTSFQMGGKLYLMNGTDFLVYDGSTVKNVADTPYIPTLTIARTPSGGGSPNEDFNLIGAGFKDSFSADGTATAYQLSLKGLDSTAVTAVVNNANKTEGTDFTVDRTAGKVTFTTAPTGGTDNVVITAYKTFADKPQLIKNCTFSTLFGGSNDTRVFVSGNSKYKNRTWRSGLYDPSYWPENGFYKIGADNEPIQGYAKKYDYLIVEKEHSKWQMTYSIASDGSPTFPIKPLNGKVGTIAPNSIQIIENSPISLDAKGVYELVGTNVRDEMNVAPLSFPVNPKLLRESNLNKAISIDFDNKYWLAVNGNVYVYDYIIKQWLMYDNIHASCFFVLDSTLYFGAEGYMYQFNKETDLLPWNDDGEAINAHWYSKLLDFQAPEMKKLVRHIYMTLKPGNHTSVNLYIRTDKKGETLVATKRQDMFNFLLMNFNEFSFSPSDVPQEETKKVKEKKITHIQLKLENNSLDESLGITSLGIDYMMQGVIK